MTGWKQRTAILLGALLALLAFLAVSHAQEASEGEETATLGMVTSDEYGDFVVDADGFTLYLLTADSAGVSTCIGECAVAWPPLLTDGEPVPSQVLHLTGAIEREDGSLQVTYNAYPLYRFAQDKNPVQDGNPGDMAGQGLDGPGGKWYMITPSGEPIETAVYTEDNASDGADEEEAGDGQ